MLYIIGLGLDCKSISKQGLEIIKKCKRIYLENYTVEFPYSIACLKNIIEKKIIPADRKKVESCKLIDEAKKLDVALLVYGSPLTATTHITLLDEAKKSGIKCKIIYNASIFDAVAETGLQLYKFGKIASMPKFEADSYIEIVKNNQKINAHSLILIDIGLDFKTAIEKLKKDCEKHEMKLKKIIVCSKLGTKETRIYYNTPDKLKEKNPKTPFCFIFPEKLHFMEKEFLEKFK